MNLTDHIGLCENKQIIVSLEILSLPIRETFPTIVGFLQFILLDHGSHRPIKDEDALG